MNDIMRQVAPRRNDHSLTNSVKFGLITIHYFNKRKTKKENILLALALY